MAHTAHTEGFVLGTPALVCRWRLANRALPLENRHLRALSQRRLGGRPVDQNLVAWAKQHVEWTLSAGAAEHPNGVLMLVIDEAGQATMAVGPYEPLADVSSRSLVERARLSATEAEGTGIAPETLWLVRGGDLVLALAPSERLAGATSLVADLARQLGVRVERREALANPLLAVDGAEGVFLVSDEHGVVVADDRPSERAERFAGAYRRLLEKTDRR